MTIVVIMMIPTTTRILIFNNNYQWIHTPKFGSTYSMKKTRTLFPLLPLWYVRCRQINQVFLYKLVIGNILLITPVDQVRGYNKYDDDSV